MFRGGVFALAIRNEDSRYKNSSSKLEEVARLQGEFIISTGNWARFNQTTTHNNTKKAVTTSVITAL